MPHDPTSDHTKGNLQLLNNCIGFSGYLTQRGARKGITYNYGLPHGTDKWQGS